MKKWICSLMVVVFFSVFGCATFVKNSYYTLDATGVTYAGAMTAVGAATVSGKITADQRAKINAGALIVYNAFNVLDNSLVAYNDSSSATLQQQITSQITALLSGWADLAGLINSIIPNSVPSASLRAFTLKGKTVGGQTFTVTVKKLDSGEISIIIQIGAAIIQYLIPAIQSFINDLAKISISDADIIALKSLIKPPDQY